MCGKLKLDEYESGVIFHALNDERNRMLEKNQETDAVDDVLLKVIDMMEKPKRRKRGRCHEER